LLFAYTVDKCYIETVNLETG